MFIAQIRCSDEASYGRDALPFPQDNFGPSRGYAGTRAAVVLRALLQLQLAEVHPCHPKVVPCSSPGLGLSEPAGSWEEEPAVCPHGAQSQVGSRESQPALIPSWDGATQRTAPSRRPDFTPSFLPPSLPASAALWPGLTQMARLPPPRWLTLGESAWQGAET